MKRTILTKDERFSDQTKRDESEAHNGYCRVKGCLERIHSFHHRVPNTITNRRLYPLFTQSPLNCAGLCFEHHEGHATAGVDITEKEAAVYENFLQGLVENGRI
jgi:hypothetical protein